MTSVLTLVEAKDHLRVTGTVEDTKITGYIESAQDHITNYLDGATFLGESPLVWPAATKHFARIAVAAFYEQQPIPDSAYDLIFPYRENIGI